MRVPMCVAWCLTVCLTQTFNSFADFANVADNEQERIFQEATVSFVTQVGHAVVDVGWFSSGRMGPGIHLGR